MTSDDLKLLAKIESKKFKECLIFLSDKLNLCTTQELYSLRFKGIISNGVLHWALANKPEKFPHDMKKISNEIENFLITNQREKI